MSKITATKRWYALTSNMLTPNVRAIHANTAVTVVLVGSDDNSETFVLSAGQVKVCSPKSVGTVTGTLIAEL